jgi:hypothetical protein
MRVVLPGPGFARGGIVATNQVVYVHIGPMAGDKWLRRIRLDMSTDGAGILGIAPVLTGSISEDAAAHAAGLALITNTSAILNGKPALSLTTGAAFVHGLWLPVGVPLRVGSQYVLVAFSSVPGAIMSYLNVGVETLELRENPSAVRKT